MVFHDVMCSVENVGGGGGEGGAGPCGRGACQTEVFSHHAKQLVTTLRWPQFISLIRTK